MYYVSDNNYISSSVAEGWSLAGPIRASGKNYSTAVGTRTLSIASVPGSDVDSDPSINNSTQNLAILYYENPAGNVSALLQRMVWTYNSSGVNDVVQRQSQWLDITSQSSKSLPSDFLNVVDTEDSHTLWESAEVYGRHTTLSTPFTSRANFSHVFPSPGTYDMGVVFYAPDNGSFGFESYDIGLQGPGNYSGCMCFVSLYLKWFLAS